MRRSARSMVCERTDGLWGLPPELMCRVQRGKTWYSGSVGVYCRRTRVKMEILVETLLDRAHDFESSGHLETQAFLVSGMRDMGMVASASGRYPLTCAVGVEHAPGPPQGAGCERSRELIRTREGDHPLMSCSVVRLLRESPN